MKRKIVAMMLIAVMAVNVTACGESTDKSVKTNKSATDSNKDTSKEEKSDDELSQAEWMEKYGDQEGKEL